MTSRTLALTKKTGAPDAQGADRFGGTRAGKENVEPAQDEGDRGKH